MKVLTLGLAISLGVLAGSAMATQVLTVGGQERTLQSLTEECQSITGDPAAQIACFGALSALLEQQTGGAQAKVSVPEKLEALRTAAQYQDDASGLVIAGSDCNINIIYYGNYFHISRRNVSTIDLVSAQLDASKLQHEQTVQNLGGQLPLSRGVMEAGATATMRGGAALDSSLDNFAPRSPRMTLDVYAKEVVGQLQPRDGQSFEFVLVHPQRAQASGDIWSAFSNFVAACRG